MVDKLTVACFSGHRKLPRDCEELREKLEKEIVALIKRGVVFFGAGGAWGFDMLAEEMILTLKGKFPHIKLVLVLPCPPEQQTLNWGDDLKQRYYNIYHQADKVKVLSPQYTSKCMLTRNRHLVDNSTYLVCYLREDRGGTFYTVDYADRQGLEIIRL